MRRSFGESSGRRARISAGTSTGSGTATSIRAGAPRPTTGRVRRRRGGNPPSERCPSAIARDIKVTCAEEADIMSISVEDWDDLSEARRRRDERAALFYTPPGEADLDGAGDEAPRPTRPARRERSRSSPPRLPRRSPRHRHVLDEDAFGDVRPEPQAAGLHRRRQHPRLGRRAPDRRRRARRARVLRLDRAADRVLRAARVAPRPHRADLPGRRAAAAGHDHQLLR